MREQCRESMCMGGRKATRIPAERVRMLKFTIGPRRFTRARTMQRSVSHMGLGGAIAQRNAPGTRSARPEGTDLNASGSGRPMQSLFVHMYVFQFRLAFEETHSLGGFADKSLGSGGRGNAYDTQPRQVGKMRNRSDCRASYSEFRGLMALRVSAYALRIEIRIVPPRVMHL